MKKFLKEEEMPSTEMPPDFEENPDVEPTEPEMAEAEGESSDTDIHALETVRAQQNALLDESDILIKERPMGWQSRLSQIGQELKNLNTQEQSLIDKIAGSSEEQEVQADEELPPMPSEDGKVPPPVSSEDETEFGQTPERDFEENYQAVLDFLKIK